MSKLHAMFDDVSATSDSVRHARKHGFGCTAYYIGGRCVSDCEKDADLRKRILEWYEAEGKGKDDGE